LISIAESILNIWGKKCSIDRCWIIYASGIILYSRIARKCVYNNKLKHDQYIITVGK